MKPEVDGRQSGTRAAQATWLLLILCLAMALLGACAVGPDYHRPAVDTPATFRTAASDARDLSDPASLADFHWAQVIQDPQLQAYIREALTNNWDVQIAVARVLQAEAAARVTRSQFVPTVVAGGDLTTTRASERGPTTIPSGIDPQKEYGDVYVSMPAYELDLWGRIRRAHEAARAQLLAAQVAQHTVRQTLVAQVATAYLNLLELDYELEITQQTYRARTNSLALTTAREEGGVTSLQDVEQARILVATAEASLVDTRGRIERQENELCILLGRNPGPLERGEGFSRQNLEVTVPPGLPSSLLERRPDIRYAEQQLVAANADIGQAKAAFFPALTLTGLYGYQTVALSDLFTAPARTWQFGPSLSVPIFTGGALRGNLNLARARFEEAVARYRQTVQGAFREVSDSLIAYQRTREYVARMQQLVGAYRRSANLANTRYEGGVTSYLEVLYNEQELFDAEIALARAQRSQLLSVIGLYRSLGGGSRENQPLASE